MRLISELEWSFVSGGDGESGQEVVIVGKREIGGGGGGLTGGGTINAAPKGELAPNMSMAPIGIEGPNLKDVITCAVALANAKQNPNWRTVTTAAMACTEPVKDTIKATAAQLSENSKMYPDFYNPWEK